ncbi:MAG: ribulokinase [Deltaproteobacteria bacterium]|nr:ribulokinase [Deltaproteobacteria bacterium]
MRSKYTIGLDFGTNSVRALVVDVADGSEAGTSVWPYRHGEDGVIIDPDQPDLARQHPADYLEGTKSAVQEALAEAKSRAGFSPDDVIGIGVDTTGSTPMPLDRAGQALAFQPEFTENPAAMAWLWKDHTGHAEAAEITSRAEEARPEYLAKCGGTYSSEWFWSKILKCRRTAPEVFDAAHTWVEIADWIPAVLTGTTRPDRIKRGICAAGHKAMFNPVWNGYPDREFIKSIDAALPRVRDTLPDTAFNAAQPAGFLTSDWAYELGLSSEIPVAVGALDAHLGGVGSGIRPGVLVKIIGTSTCDMMVAPMDKDLPDIPGLCGIVPESILPGAYGLEAGQSAVGDIFNWFVNYIQPGGNVSGSHQELTRQAEKLKPGQSGLIGLDWHNGNRTILVDQRLTGMLMGMSLHTTPAEIYRALVESTAFGARVIMERFEEYGLKVDRVVNCGGISVRNPMVMQIYADIMARPLEIARSEQACALGAAMAGAVTAGSRAGGYHTFDEAMAKMTGTLEKKYLPDLDHSAVYERLYRIYRRLHDIFGTPEYKENLQDVMKELLDIRDRKRSR